jgi:hypothetical protein
VNVDYVCNGGDLVAIGLPRYWGQTRPDNAGWVRADVNRDGAVNGGDLVVLGLPENWLATWAPAGGPWADNFDFNYYAVDDYTTDAAAIAATEQNTTIGAGAYSASSWYNEEYAAEVYGFMAQDVVWSIYGHANSDEVSLEPIENQDRHIERESVAQLDLHRLKLAVFYGCYTSQGGSNSIASTAVQAGAGAAVGFSDCVFWGGGATAGPHYTWSYSFWTKMANGVSVRVAAEEAMEAVRARHGSYRGTNLFEIFGNDSQTIMLP